MEHCLHHLLRRSAERFPDRPAVEDGERALTYVELNERSDRVANLLLEIGVERGDRVGLHLEKSVEAVVAIYGVLKAGAAYVPLDPRAPASRLALIAGDCDLRIVISEAEKADSWGELVEHGAPIEVVIAANLEDTASEPRVPALRVLSRKDIDRQDDRMPTDRANGNDLAYILYTSGSTGRPKGVMLSHANALGFVRWAVDRFGVCSTDRLSNHAPLHFDLSVFDLFAASAAGAAVVLVPPELSLFPVQIRDVVDRKAISIWYSVPSILSMLALRGGLRKGDLPNLRTVLFAGEVFPTKYLQGLMRLLPHARFFNLYGPTETNVCTWFEVSPIAEGETEPIPIGRPIDGVEVFAMTDEGRTARIGEVGELYVRGVTVMRGYWGDAPRTALSLIPDPRDGASRELAYNTGDLVRQDSDGNYRLLGRRDQQIKSRGYRIELGEIESAMLAHPGVLECAVVAIPDPLVTNRIKALVVTDVGIGVHDLVRFCGDRLPHYMIPERFEFREALPKTSTGKIDRHVLSAVAADRS